MRLAERFDVLDKVVHTHLMRRICPSRQDGSDGYVRKLWHTPAAWDTAAMQPAQFDLDLIKRVLAEATGDNGSFSQRGLAKAAGEGRDSVGDIINGRNKNPTIKVLSNLAHALGGDLSMFGLAEERVEPPTEAELEAALLDMLPGMPKGTLDRRARYLAGAVAGALKLRRGPLGETDHPSNGRGEAAPPLSPTT